MKAFLPLDFGEKVHCKCKDDSCYHALEQVIDEIWFYDDVTDEQSKMHSLTVGEDIHLCKVVEVNEQQALANLYALVTVQMDFLKKENARLKRQLAKLKRASR